MIVPTVLATIARRNCRLCSASESWPMVIPVVVIPITPFFGFVLFGGRPTGSGRVVFF